MSNNYESQNQDLRPTLSGQISELDDNELDSVAGGDIGDWARDLGQTIGGTAIDIASAPFWFGYGLAEGADNELS